MRISVAFVSVVIASCASTPGSGPEQKSVEHEEALAHYLTAVYYQRSGQFEKAIAEMRAVTELAPEATWPLFQMIQAHLRLQNYEGALATCQKALATNAQDSRLWILLGSIHNRLNRYDEAEDAFQHAIRLEPDSVLGYSALVDIEENTNDLISAIDVYKKLIALTPNAGVLHFRLGVNLAQTNNLEEAYQALARAVELNPRFTQSRQLFGIVCLDLNRNPEAAAQFQALLDQEPDNPSATEYLAAVLARGKQYSQAAKLLTGLIDRGRSEPGHAIDWMYLSLRAQRFREVGDAPVPNEAPALGTLLRAMGRRQSGGAYRILLESLDSLTTDIDAECNDYLSSLLYLFGNQDTGAYLVSNLVRLKESGVGSKLLETVLARTLMSLEKDGEAEVVLSKALSTYGDDKWLHYYLAGIYEERDQIGDAEKHLKACLAQDPDDPEMMNFLGYMYADESINLDEAERLLNRALELDPENGFYLDSLGWIHYRKGHAERAIELIRKAIIVLDTDDAVLRDHLGDAYLLKGDVEKALAQWQRAHRLDPKLEGVREKITRHRPAAAPEE